MHSDHPYLLRAALRERKAQADRLAHAILLGFACGCVSGMLVFLAVAELVR